MKALVNIKKREEKTMTTDKATLTREIQRLYNHEHEAKMEMNRLAAEVEALTYENQKLWDALSKKSV